MRLSKRIAMATCAGVISLTCVGCDIKTDTPVIGNIMGLTDEQALKMGDLICSTDEVKVVLMNLQNSYKKDFGGQVSWEQNLGDTTLEEFILDKVQMDLSVVYAVSAIATQNEVTLTDEEESLIKQAAQEYVSGLTEAEKSYSNATEETVESIYKNYYLADKEYYNETSAISDTISDEEARVMKIQYIYIDTSKTAVEEAQDTLATVKKQVENGYQDFLLQANKYSDYEKVEINIKKNEADKDYEKKAFELKEGKLSEVITEDEGVYLVKCANSYLEKETIENKEQIILDSKISKFEEIYSEFIEENSSDINSDVWKEMKFSTDENVNASNLFDVYDKYLKVENVLSE